MHRGVVLVIIAGFIMALVVVFLLPLEISGGHYQGNAPATLLAPVSFSHHGGSREIAFVSRVIDGDTIQVQILDSKTGKLGDLQTVRYIGMDTPETVDPNKPVECFGHEASARDKQLVEGNYVVLEKDVSDRDKYGRLLRFVFLLDGTFIDLELVREGYARMLTIPPDIKYENEFAAAESSARGENLGFWGACSSYPFL